MILSLIYKNSLFETGLNISIIRNYVKLKTVFVIFCR